MNIKSDDLLMAEEMELAITNLATLTRNNTLRWELKNYTPLMLLPTNDNQQAYLCHKIQATATRNGHSFYLEISELIYLPSGRGDISIMFMPDWSGNPQYSKSISDYDPFDSTPLSELLDKFQCTPPVIIADAVIPQLDIPIASSIAKLPFLHLSLPHFENYPIVALARTLSDTGRVTDLHRCVLDAAYRNQLFLSNTI